VAKEVVPSWTDLTRGVLEKALTDRWNQDPGVCFCRIPGKHPEPVTVPEGYVKSRRSVFDTSRRSCYIEIDRIRAFVSRYGGLDPTRRELEELDGLRKALKEQWRYVKLMVTSKGPEVLSGSDNVVSALGEAVDAALLCSREFVGRCLAKSLGDEAPTDKDTCIVDDRVTPESTTHRQDEVAVKSVTMEHVEKWTDFTECKQAQDEVFEAWWDRMQAKAGECALETMNGDDVMMLELIRGVSYSKLQQRLLMDPEPTLSGLVRIAEQWQVQTAEDGGNTMSSVPPLGQGASLFPKSSDPPLCEGAALYHAHTIDTLEDETEA
jgi:hypothetical protein